MSLVDDKIAPMELLEMILLAADNLEAGHHHVEFSLETCVETEN